MESGEYHPPLPGRWFRPWGGVVDLLVISGTVGRVEELLGGTGVEWEEAGAKRAY